MSHFPSVGLNVQEFEGHDIFSEALLRSFHKVHSIRHKQSSLLSSGAGVRERGKETVLSPIFHPASSSSGRVKVLETMESVIRKFVSI